MRSSVPVADYSSIQQDALVEDHAKEFRRLMTCGSESIYH